MPPKISIGVGSEPVRTKDDIQTLEQISASIMNVSNRLVALCFYSFTARTIVVEDVLTVKENSLLKLQFARSFLVEFFGLKSKYRLNINSKCFT